MTVVVSLLLPSAFAADAADEIDYLIQAIQSSDCVFVRNGKRHEPDEAASHLRMKYSRGKKYAGSAEKFIERLASKSSFSGKPYFMECAGRPPQPSADWLMQKLQSYRSE